MKIQNVTDDNQYLDSVVVDSRPRSSSRPVWPKPNGWPSPRRPRRPPESGPDRHGAGRQEHRRGAEPPGPHCGLEATPRPRRRRRPSRTQRATAEQEPSSSASSWSGAARGRCRYARQGQPEAKQLAAQAEAAKIIEDGKAQVEVFASHGQYQAAGDDGQRIFVLNMLPSSSTRSCRRSTMSISIGSPSSTTAVVRAGIPASCRVAGCGRLAHRADEAATGVDILGSMRSDQAELEPDSELPPPPPAPEA